jgi:hypothetical protein
MTFTTSTTYAELNAVLDQARRPSANPVPVTDAQLLGLQHRWTTALSARLDEAVEFAEPRQEVEAVANAWRTLASDLDTLRRVLDANETSSEALANAMRPELRMLAITAGLSGLDAPSEESVRVGHSLRQAIRSGNGKLPQELAHAS